jgi:hypothetical protein
MVSLAKNSAAEATTLLFSADRYWQDLCWAFIIS